MNITEDNKNPKMAVFMYLLYYGLIFATLFDYTPVTTMMVYYVLVGSLLMAATAFSVIWVGKIAEVPTWKNIRDMRYHATIKNLKVSTVNLHMLSNILVIAAFYVYGLHSLVIAAGILLLVSLTCRMLLVGIKQELMVLKLKGDID